MLAAYNCELPTGILGCQILHFWRLVKLPGIQILKFYLVMDAKLFRFGTRKFHFYVVKQQNWHLLKGFLASRHSEKLAALAVVAVALVFWPVLPTGILGCQFSHFWHPVKVPGTQKFRLASIAWFGIIWHPTSHLLNFILAYYIAHAICRWAILSQTFSSTLVLFSLFFSCLGN